MKIVVILIICFCILTLLISLILNFSSNKKMLKTIGGSWEQLERDSWKGSKEDFLRYYYNARQYKRAGVYIHKNLSNGKCYVGQSHNIFQRVKDELDGKATNKGCKLLYEAYQNGCEFEIILIFRKKGYPNLHKMEKAYIDLHEAVNNGYNKTFGNDEITGETLYDH